MRFICFSLFLFSPLFLIFPAEEHSSSSESLQSDPQGLSERWFFHLGVSPLVFINTYVERSKGPSLPFVPSQNDHHVRLGGGGFLPEFTIAYGIPKGPRSYRGLETQLAYQVFFIHRQSPSVGQSFDGPIDIVVSHRDEVYSLRANLHYFEKMMLLSHHIFKNNNESWLIEPSFTWFFGPSFSWGFVNHQLLGSQIPQQKAYEDQLFDVGLELGGRFEVAIFYLGAMIFSNTLASFGAALSLGVSF